MHVHRKSPFFVAPLPGSPAVSFSSQIGQADVTSRVRHDPRLHSHRVPWTQSVVYLSLMWPTTVTVCGVTRPVHEQCSALHRTVSQLPSQDCWPVQVA